jgi:crotonobetainyl-CoA:carnitine CoA-transferase CaiB-like acyl-CoA transferase
MGGMTIAGGIAGALFKRERTGEPSVVDVSLLAAGSWAMSAGIALSLQWNTPWAMPAGGAGLPGNPLVGIYQTSDERWVSVVMLQGFHYWPDFCEHIGRPELVDDERFNSVEKLNENGAAARDIVSEVFKTATLAEWTQRLATLKGQWAPVQHTLEVAADPQVAANGYIARTATREGVEFDLVASPVQFDEKPTATNRAPEFNEHGDAILEELGYDWDAIIAMKTAGAVT